MAAQEISLIPSRGCLTTSFTGPLALVACGKLNPMQMVNRRLPVEQASQALDSMTSFNRTGFNVISHMVDFLIPAITTPATETMEG